MVKNLPVNEGDRRDAGLIPGSGTSPGGGQRRLAGYSLQGCKEWIRLKQLSTCAHMGVVVLCCMLAESMMEWKP